MSDQLKLHSTFLNILQGDDCILTVLFGCYIAGASSDLKLLSSWCIFWVHHTSFTTSEPHTSLQCHFIQSHIQRVHNEIVSLNLIQLQLFPYFLVSFAPDHTTGESVRRKCIKKLVHVNSILFVKIVVNQYYCELIFIRVIKFNSPQGFRCITSFLCSVLSNKFVFLLLFPSGVFWREQRLTILQQQWHSNCLHWSRMGGRVPPTRSFHGWGIMGPASQCMVNEWWFLLNPHSSMKY